MKKIILLFVAFAAHISFAQNTYPFPASGNVGIGTNNPLTTLDVVGLGRFRVPDDQSGIGGLTIETTGGTNLKMGGNFTYSWIQSHMSLPLYINDLGNNTIINPRYGNVGIGTINPSVKLDVVSSDVAAFFRSTANSVPVSIINSGTSISTIGFKGSTSLTEYNVRVGVDGNDFISYTSNVERMRINSNGNIGIGTTNPLNKLDVNGTIHSKEVKVDMLGWSDFVFKKEYSLPTLEEVEKQITEKGHLKNIPSEEEVLKNGINLGEMNAKLLQKIEEMTLYMIEMKKDITFLKQENKELKTQIYHK